MFVKCLFARQKFLILNSRGILFLISYAPFSTVVKIYSRHKTYEEAKEVRAKENLIGLCFIATYVEVCHYLDQKR